MNAPVVRTDLGYVKGEDREGVYVFRGIPYGEDTSGKNRFLPPRPAKPWEGVFDATKNGHICMQKGGSISRHGSALGRYFNGGEPEKFGVLQEEKGEDCLVLNVLTPSLTGKKPVLVYFHGGGFINGSGTLFIGADRFVRENDDIVLVSVNHRINIFGFLYLGAFDEAYKDSGMAGMLDLVESLRWVQKNISAFGGDPGNVTILGESGGAQKVTLLMDMPEAQGLFHKAVIESGSAPTGTYSKEEAAQHAKRVLKKLNIGENELSKLLSISKEELFSACIDENGQTVRFAPVADGIHQLPNETGEFTVSGFSKHIPVLIGSSEDETAIFGNDDVHEGEGVSWEKGNAEEYIARRLLAPDADSLRRNKGGCFPEKDNLQKILHVFRENNAKNDDPEHTYHKIASYFSFLGGGAYYHALSRANAGCADVFVYSVSYDSIHPARTDRRYAWHTAELPLQMRVVLNPESEKLSLTLSKTLAQFVKTANPSIDGLDWPPFTPEERLTMVFDDECRAESEPQRALHEAFPLYEA